MAISAAAAETETIAPRGPVPLVAHLIHRLAAGGLENGIVNLINHMPPERYRHAIICLAGYTDFRERIERPGVPVFSLDKREGKNWGAYWRLWRLLREVRPDILHTRTLGTLDAQLYGALAGVRARVHGEHGRGSSGAEGSGWKQKLLRRSMSPLVHHYTVVSADLANFLTGEAGVPRARVTQIYNGVDTGRFHPRCSPRAPLGPLGVLPDDAVVIGTVGRMEPVKDQACLARAFLSLVEASPLPRKRLRLVMVGAGPLHATAHHMLEAAGAAGLAWLPGERDDIPGILRAMDIFVLPSLAEGTSNTILEAMATGLPVIATRAGGNPELVDDGRTGFLVPAGDAAAIAASIRRYLENPGEMRRHGEAGRRTALERFSLQAMIDGYLSVYDAVLRERCKPAARGAK